MKAGASRSFGAQLKALREAAGFTQEELATIAGLSVHAVSALERGQRRRPHVETVRALSAALDLTGPTRDALVASARAPAHHAAVDELRDVSLPLALTALLGRDADMQTLRQWLADPAARLITLTGPGGAGKTRLALELARAIAAEGASVCCSSGWPPFGTPRSWRRRLPRLSASSDATALDLPRRARAACDGTAHAAGARQFRAGPGRGAAGRGSSDGGRRAPSAGHQPRPASCARRAGVRRGTTRAGCGLDTASPADLARSPAVRLFVERVRDVQPDFRLTSANGPTVTAICRRLDALPLALELAAPWIKVLTAEDLLRRLTARCPALDRRAARSPRTPADDECDGRLELSTAGPNEQRVFRRLGALPGRFPIEAAAAVLAGREGSSAAERRSARRGGWPDRQEPPAASRELSGDSSAVPDARNRAGVRGARAHRGG